MAAAAHMPLPPDTPAGQSIPAAAGKLLVGDVSKHGIKTMQGLSSVVHVPLQDVRHHVCLIGYYSMGFNLSLLARHFHLSTRRRSS
jgi:hypothetical protein